MHSSFARIGRSLWRAAPPRASVPVPGDDAPPAAVVAAAGLDQPFGPTRRRSRGFTLLEILLVLAIMGLIASVLVGGAARLLTDRPVSPEEIFWKAVQEARKMALKNNDDVGLQFVSDDASKSKAFVVTDGNETKQFPVPAADNLEINFLAAQPTGGNMIMVAGTVLETQKVAVTFYPDGTCTAFRTQFFRNGDAHIVSIDPWTCAPVLTPADPNNPSAPST